MRLNCFLDAAAAAAAASAAAVRSMPAARQEPHLGSCAIHLKVLLHSSLIPPSRQRALGIAAPMSQRVNALAPAALSISKICDAQREFDSSIRALNDFFVRKKRGSTGLLLTPTRSLHEKGLVSLRTCSRLPFSRNRILCRSQIISQLFQLSALNLRASVLLPCTLIL